eukprot:TRINITY_DN5658_c0_g1_i1.p1 TRINITY_DN5658_c0_g1~~TRINITY_DN5658_c0_g1_i1.p1  ORF type:complete len:139 (-),score=36.29 TRINITY_DN5658_c0_g1_i1:142-558(-)
MCIRDRFTMMSFAAIIVNTLNIFYLNYSQSDQNTLSYFKGVIYSLIAGEHFMILLKYILSFIIQDTPQWVEEARRQRRKNKETAESVTGEVSAPQPAEEVGNQGVKRFHRLVKKVKAAHDEGQISPKKADADVGNAFT